MYTIDAAKCECAKLGPKPSMHGDARRRLGRRRLGSTGGWARPASKGSNTMLVRV